MKTTPVLFCVAFLCMTGNGMAQQYEVYRLPHGGVSVMTPQQYGDYLAAQAQADQDRIEQHKLGYSNEEFAYHRDGKQWGKKYRLSLGGLARRLNVKTVEARAKTFSKTRFGKDKDGHKEYAAVWVKAFVAGWTGQESPAPNAN